MSEIRPRFFCLRIHARDSRPAAALFLFRALRGLADPASGFRQTSALVASVKNCIHPSTAQRILLMTRDEISLSAEILRLSQFRAISGDTVPILFP